MRDLAFFRAQRGKPPRKTAPEVHEWPPVEVTSDFRRTFADHGWSTRLPRMDRCDLSVDSRYPVDTCPKVLAHRDPGRCGRGAGTSAL